MDLHSSASIEEKWFVGGPIEPENLDTPLIRLLELVYQNDPAQSRYWLRKPITLSYDPTELCHQMMRVHAKRWIRGTSEKLPSQVQMSDVDPSVSLAGRFQTYQEKIHLSQRDHLIKRLDTLKLRSPRAEQRYGSARPVSAMLFDSQQNCVLEAWNTNAVFKHHHAEFNLLIGAIDKKISPQQNETWTLVSSLKPCKACAAAIEAYFATRSKITVYYTEDDPGPNARLTPQQCEWIKRFEKHA